MKRYQKPSISILTRTSSLVPAAAAAGIGGAFLMGVAMGLSGDKRTGVPFLAPLKKCVSDGCVLSH